jgi:hypothetical protein
VTGERIVPELQALEVPGLPHAAASWGRDSSKYRVWGLPPIFAIWTLGLLATWTLGSRFTKTDDSSGNTRWDLFFAIAISLWYPCATLAESGVAVASALRWITTIVFLLGCLALCFWIRRIDRQNEPSATASIDRFDSLFSSLSIHTAAPWLIIGAIVLCAVLLQAQWTQQKKHNILMKGGGLPDERHCRMNINATRCTADPPYTASRRGTCLAKGTTDET